MPLSRAQTHRQTDPRTAGRASRIASALGPTSGGAPADLRFDALADSLEQMIWTARADGASDYFNARWRTFTGLPASDGAADAWQSCVHPDDLAGLRAAWAQSLRSGEAYEAEYRLRHVSGQYRWIVARACALRDDQGRVLRWYGACTDVHDLRMAEDALAQTQAALSAQSDLRRSARLDAMGQIAGGVAHDFNNLLTPILGGLDLLQRRGVDAGDARLQRVIAGGLASAERAQTLAQRLLAFARRQPLTPGPVSLPELIDDMRQILSTTLTARVRLHVDAPASLPCAHADQNPLEVALLNLAANARDAMPDGGDLRISVRLVPVRASQYAGVAPGYYLQLRMADTGCGMDEATRMRAIEPFFTTKGVGRGLGLSMAHGLITQLGGALAIESAPGAGCAVTCLLPTANSPYAQAPEPADAAAAIAPGRVLLADDESEVRASMAHMLEAFGQEVIEAGSAEDAMRRLESGQRFDLVITDHLMPGMSGAELTRHIRAHWPDQKILIVSGFGCIDDLPADIPRLPKPFRHADLARVLPTLLPRD